MYLLLEKIFIGVIYSTERFRLLLHCCVVFHLSINDLKTFFLGRFFSYYTVFVVPDKYLLIENIFFFFTLKRIAVTQLKCRASN